MAKLSLIGICSLSHQIIDKDGKVNIHNIEMNQDDFEDCVMLTIEEAKKLLPLVNWGADWSTNLPEDDLIAQSFERKIEQAEVAKIGDDYNKALNKVVEEFQKQAEDK